MLNHENRGAQREIRKMGTFQGMYSSSLDALNEMVKSELLKRYPGKTSGAWRL
jgi:hypothetical protein